MQLVKNSLSFIVSSNPANGARNVRLNGSFFTVQLDEPISVPATAKTCTLEVNNASVWWTVPNISVDLNNNMFYFNDGTADKSFEIPKGLYSVASLNTLFARELANLGYDGDLISVSGDDSTQRAILTFKTTGVSVDFTQPDTPREILGFDSRVVGPSTVSGESFEGDTIAKFNSVNSFLLHSSIINGGIPVNDRGENIITKIPITVSPGNQINYQPFQPVTTDASNLIGKYTNSFNVWLTDQDNNPVDTNEEYFDALIVLRWYEPV